jgi:hypothetical protein
MNIRNKIPTDKATEYLTQLKASAEDSAVEYLRWLNSLIEGERVNIRRESRDMIFLIEAQVIENHTTHIVVTPLSDEILPGGVRYEAGEPITVSKHVDMLIAGKRTLTPVAPKYQWAHEVNAMLTAVL